MLVLAETSDQSLSFYDTCRGVKSTCFIYSPIYEMGSSVFAWQNVSYNAKTKLDKTGEVDGNRRFPVNAAHLLQPVESGFWKFLIFGKESQRSVATTPTEESWC